MRYRINGREVSQEEFDGHGNPSRMQEMFESGIAPGCMTDTVFLEGHANGSQFQDTPHLGDYYASVAKSHGVNPKGKVYLSGLAAFPGDPKAWVDGRGDVQRVLEERGWEGRGAVNVKGAEATEKKKVAVADDIVDAAVERQVALDPGLAEMDAGELRHEVTEAIKPHWS